MGGSTSKQPGAGADAFKLNKNGELTQDQFVFIMDNYMLATRLFVGEKKYAKINKDTECYQRYFVECGKKSKQMLKKHGITSMQVCLSPDYSQAMYTINHKKSHTIKFDSDAKLQLKEINDRLQPYNGYGSQAPCYNKH